MSGRLRCLLIGGRGGGGEEVFVRSMAASPPPDVDVGLVVDHHQELPGARCRRLEEVAFNRLVHPWIWPLPGLRSYSLEGSWSLVHVHNFPHRIRAPHGTPIVMSLGGGSYEHYMYAYLGYSPDAVDRIYRRAATVYRRLGIGDEVVNWKHLSGIAVFSRFARDHLVRRGVNPGIVSIIPPGFATPRMPERPERSSIAFLFVGRAPHRKGADLVVQAFRRVRELSPGVRLVMAGDASYSTLDEPGLEAHGWVPRERVLGELLPRTDVVLLPARAEGYGFAIVEAMSFGLPAIASDQGAFPEIVDPGNTGFLVPIDDADALTDAMLTFVRHPELARQMGRRARDRFEEQHTRERYHERLRSFYEAARSRSRA